MEKSASSWIAPDGAVYPLHGKGHSEFAYDILLNEKMGEHMAKKPTLIDHEQKGKSGEHAKADAMAEIGNNPGDPKHSEALKGKGWVQASASGDRMLIMAADMVDCRKSWCQIASIGSSFSSVIFAIGRSGNGITVGLTGKDLTLPAEIVIQRITSSGRPSSGSLWTQHHGTKYFG